MSHPKPATKLRALALLPLLLAACKLGGGTETFSPGSACIPVDGACAENSDCCSYACVDGACAPNILEGGVCRTSNDCSDPMDCKSGACVNGATCRDDQDVCDGDVDCCSGNCAGAVGAAQGTCLPNHAPVVSLGEPRQIPKGQPFTLHTAATTDPDHVLVYTASDPDGDALVLGWSLVAPGGSAASLSSATAATVTFVPDVEGPYELRLVVTDGTSLPDRLTAEATVVLTAVNTEPRATVTAPAQASRNVSVTVSGTATDPDGDALTCTWYATPPGGVPSVIKPEAACAGATTASFVPGVEEGWTVTLEVKDELHVTPASASVTVVNDAPVASAGADLAGNLGPPGGATPAIPVTGSATDKNGDTDFTWAWTFDAGGLPPGSQLTNASIAGAAGQAASFVPDVTGTYRLTLRVSDRPGSFTEDTVLVKVDRHVLALPWSVSDAVYAKEAERIITVGSHPTVAGQGRLTILDPATGTTLTADLSGSPTCVAASPDGSFIAMGGASAFWWATVSGGTITIDSSTARGHPVPFSVQDIAVAGDRIYLLAGYGDGWTQKYVWAYDTSSAGTAPVSTTVLGVRAAVAPTGDLMFVADPYLNRVTRYTVSQSGQTVSSLGLTGIYVGDVISDLWVAQSGTVIYGNDGGIRSASTLAALTPTLASGLVSVDTTADGRAVAVTNQGDLLLGYDSQHAPAGSDPIPVWATAGGAADVTKARFGFISASGAKRWAIVWAGGRFGLVTYP